MSDDLFYGIAFLVEICKDEEKWQAWMEHNGVAHTNGLESFIDAIVGKRLTYERLIAKVSA